MALDLKRKRDDNEVGAFESKKRLIEDSDEDESTDSDDIHSDNDDEAGDEWQGIAEPTSSVLPHPGTKPSKPPTGEELRTIKDASSLFRSNSFKLQIDALLPNVRPKSRHIPPLSAFLHALHSFLTSLPSSAPQHPLVAAKSLLKKSIAVPYALPLPTEDTNWKVAFEKPSDIFLVGSWANKCSVKGKDGRGWGVDLAVEMPESLFQEKDYLNGRFFHKRAFYLASIASAVKSQKTSLNVDLSWESSSDDTRLTTLVLTPRKDESSTDFTKLSAHIRIIPVLPTSSPIPLHRLSPSHSNIRISSSASPSPSVPQLSTPIYNTSLLLSLSPKPHLLSTHALLNTITSFHDALTLLRVWANQRGYTHGGIRGFEGKGNLWSAVLGVVTHGEEGGKRKPLGKGLSSYQLFRAALDFFVKIDWERDAVFSKVHGGHRFQPEEYQAHHSAVFVDSASLVNLLAGVPLSSLDMLRYDARKTLQMLDQASFSGDPFSEVFLKDQRSLPTRFDAIIRVNLSSVKPRFLPIQSTLDSGSSTSALLSSLSTTLRQALGNRTHAIAFLPSPSPFTRPLSQAHPSPPSTITLGLIYNPTHAFQLVTHGPSASDADSSQSEQFRDFWGPKAELRRFKDGRIEESVVWDEGVKTGDDRMGVPIMIVKYILERHFGISEVAMGTEEGKDIVKSWQGSFDSVIRLPEVVSRVVLNTGAQSGFKAAITAFDDLVKGIRALTDELPLSLSTISPASEYLRYTSVFSPVAFPSPSSTATSFSSSSLPPSARYMPPIEIVLQFEKSSRWPDDLRAIQKIKLAFFERIASALMSAIPTLKATVVIGDGSTRSEIIDQAQLEIVTEQGWAFSARIWHDREATLLDKIINDKSRLANTKQKTGPESSAYAKERQEALEAREIYTRRFIHAPRHHRAIASLCHHFSAYAGTVRLVKRWLASHWLLQGHISEEVIEIICARFFVGDGKSLGIDAGSLDHNASVPGSKERGFASVVEFLKNWKYEEGLFVPLYGSTETTELLDMAAVAVIAGSKAGVWTVSTEGDKEGHAWTAQGPEPIAALRVRALAKATWEHLQGMEQGNLDVKALFIHPTDDYDFILKLDQGVLPRYYQNVNANLSILSTKPKYVNLSTSDQSSIVRPGFDPAQLLFNDLRRIYADTLKLFYDPFGGDRFGVVLDPTLQNARPFRVLGGYSSIPKKKENDKAKDKGMVILNEASILTEIERIGSGIITQIVPRV